MSLNALVCAYEKGHLWRLALEMLPNTDLVGSSAIMSACARARRWREALEVFSSLERGHRVDLAAQSTAVFACQQAAYWQGALALLVKDPVAYTCAMGACNLAQEPGAPVVVYRSP